MEKKPPKVVIQWLAQKMHSLPTSRVMSHLSNLK